MEHTFDFIDWGSWGLGDFYADREKELRDAIASGRPFDTGWHGWKKELQSMRIKRTKYGTNVFVNMCMDSIDDYALIFDCLTDDEEDRITYEQCEEIVNDLWWSEFTTDANATESLPVDATFDDIVKKAHELMDICNDRLKASWHLCIDVTLTILYEGTGNNLENMIEERIKRIG